MDFDLMAQKGLQSLRKATSLARADLDTAMLKNIIDPILPFMGIKENPLLLLIDSGYMPGRGWYFNQQTEGSTPAEFLAESTTPTTDVESYGLKEFTHKIEGGRGEVLRFAEETGENFMSLLEQSIALKMVGHWDIMEKQMIQGTVSATAPAGLHTLVPDSQIRVNSSSAAGAIFSETNLIYALTKAKIKPGTGWIVSSDMPWMQMNAIVLADRRHNNTIMIEGGAIVDVYQGIPWSRSTNITETMTFDGTQTTALTGGSCSEIFVARKYIGDSNIPVFARKFLRQPEIFFVSGDEDIKIKYSIMSKWVLGLTKYHHTYRIPGINCTNMTE